MKRIVEMLIFAGGVAWLLGTGLQSHHGAEEWTRWIGESFLPTKDSPMIEGAQVWQQTRKGAPAVTCSRNTITKPVATSSSALIAEGNSFPATAAGGRRWMTACPGPASGRACPSARSSAGTRGSCRARVGYRVGPTNREP